MDAAPDGYSNDMPGTNSNESTDAAADDEAGQREAVDDATSERVSDTVRRDPHGEIIPDPYPNDDESEPDTEVLEQHRRDAETIEGRNDQDSADDEAEPD